MVLKGTEDLIELELAEQAGDLTARQQRVDRLQDRRRDQLVVFDEEERLLVLHGNLGQDSFQVNLERALVVG